MSLVNFLAGMGSGYIQGKERSIQQERQAKQDAWLAEQQDRQRKDWKKADALNADLAEAGKPAQVAQTQYQPADAKSDLGGGGVAPDVRPLYKVGDQAYTDQAQAQGAMEKYNSPGEYARRTMGVYQKHQQVDKAFGMESLIQDQKLKQLGLDKAMAEFARTKYNQTISDAFAAGGNWTDVATKLLTDTEVGGFKGISVKAVPSLDGKKVNFVGTGENGETSVLKSYSNDDRGKADFFNDMRRAPIEDQIAYVHERDKYKDTRADKDRAFALEEKKFNADQTHRQSIIGMQQARLAAGGGGGRGTGAPGQLNMEAVDKQLTSMLTTQDPVTGEKKIDAQAMYNMRSLVQLMPEARRGDAVGAVLAAKMRLDAAGGDANKVIQAMQINPSAPNQGQAGAPNSMTGQQYLAQLEASGPRGAQQAAALRGPGVAPASAQQPAASPAAPGYMPAPDSPAGKAAANRERLRMEQAQKEAQNQKAAADAAAQAISSKDLAAADAVQRMSGFASLPAATKVQIQKIVLGR